MRVFLFTIVVVSACAVRVQAALVPLTTFGGGDGWRAPREVVAGDVAGTTTSGNYSYLGVGNGERGLAYNRATGNLLLVSRPSPGTTAGAGTAPFVRVLNSTTGADLGGFNTTGIAFGGGGVLNKIGTTTDGVIYAANIGTTAADANPLRIYRWSSQASAMTTGGNTPPTPFFADGIPNTHRLGDTMDIMGSSANATMVFGNANGHGYVLMNTAATPTVVNSFTPNTSPNGPGSSSFDYGITFAANANQVWGKGSNNPSLLFRTTVTAPPNAVRDGVTIQESETMGQSLMDYLEIGGVPYLALADFSTLPGTTSATNRPNVSIYDMSNPSSPALVASESAVPTGISVSTPAGSGTIATANSAGQVAWGETLVVGSDLVTNLYVLTTNQGIQAFSFTVPNPVPEAGAFFAMGVAALLSAGATWLRRRRRSTVAEDLGRG